MNRRFRILVPVVLLVALVAIAGCKKKQPPPPAATAPPPAPAPTAQITATPRQISAGDQVTLTWHTTDATSASIDGIGDVPDHRREDCDAHAIDNLSPGSTRRFGHRGCERAGHGERASAGLSAREYHVGGRRIPGQCPGHLLRLRHLRHSQRRAVDAFAGCFVPGEPPRISRL